MLRILLATFLLMLSATYSDAITCGVIRKDDCDKVCPSGTKATSCIDCGLMCDECDCKVVATPATEKTDKTDKVDKAEKSDKADKADIAEKAVKAEKKTAVSPRSNKFIGIVEVNSTTAKVRMTQIADEIIGILTRDPQANVKINVEISADFPEGVSDQIKQAVSEKAANLGFKIKAWE